VLRAACSHIMNAAHAHRIRHPPTHASSHRPYARIIALLGLPGYYISVWLMDRLGRRFIQLQVAPFRAEAVYAVAMVFVAFFHIAWHPAMS
jgi:hypothetical protein